MPLSEITITKAIVERFFHKFIVGGVLLSGRRVAELILDGR